MEVEPLKPKSLSFMTKLSRLSHVISEYFLNSLIWKLALVHTVMGYHVVTRRASK